MNVLIPYESTSGFINVEKSLRGILEKDYDSYIPVINNPVTNVNKKAYPYRVHRFKKNSK